MEQEGGPEIYSPGVGKGDVGSGDGWLAMKTRCAVCAGWRKKLGPTWSSDARRAMGCGRGTGPNGKSWTISGGGDIPWKGKEERYWFGTRWKISLLPWIGFWLA